ncbi:4-hydroxy-3-methylbut-2-enyl diphosphate reductase [Rikenella microfusus]|uniref:4-hydroxy-3-methylbut-2-enyl diphosphate reductase n=1 Tax=Rikenella microfusus TaxID=28139 RepID=UPI001D8F7755|nr:4-hydroxy-3-methylbut-2-enyl diphosphate reductase [Rikenella microfusus]HJE88860.1 4-hydroxy-3-methylbut-2-enyl diphosphate reductase [Rikenella microfusus]
MKIEIDEKSGFCFGVVKAITTAEELLRARHGAVWCLGDIVHNRVEVNRLENMGLQTVGHERLPELAGKCVLIRAHGEPPATYALAERYGIELADATCPVVAKLQERVRRAWEEMRAVGGQVVILGKPGHAEVVGLTGQTNEEAVVVESLDDLSRIDFSRPVCLLSQTTQSLSLFNAMRDEILRRAADPSAVTVHDTICRQVSNRNPHLREFAARFDAVVFVSGSKSSNGKALYGVCREANARSYKVEDASELRAEWFAGVETVGVCGATSTPKWLMEKVAAAIARF